MIVKIPLAPDIIQEVADWRFGTKTTSFDWKI